MFRVKTFHKYYNFTELLDEQVAAYLNDNHIRREDIIDIKYTVNNDWLYCTVIWEDK